MVRSDEGGPNARWAGLEAERDERAGVMRAVSLLLVLVGGGAGCSSDPQVLAQAPDGPSLGLPVEHVVAPIRAWSIIGNGLTPGDERLELRVDSPTAGFVDAWLDGDAGVRLEREGETFRHSFDLVELAPGQHRVLLAADGAAQAFALLEFTRSHPLYVLTSTDWDTADNPDENLERHVELHRRHPGLLITHLLPPYTFTDESLSAERVDELVRWAVGMREDYGDELGVHIHPYRHFVEAVGVGFRSSPTALGGEDPTGYTVDLSSYDEDELRAMLEWTSALFVERGLGRPTSFRAGAWHADLETMRALVSAGFLVDTSALNVALLEEWRGAPLHAWVSEHWSTIDARSQPYYPNVDDILSSAAPRLALLELPDNGALVDYVSGAEMIEVLRANWPGGALEEPRAVSIGWHPPNFGERYFERIDTALSEFDLHLAADDAGPLVYARLSDMTRVWLRAQD